MSAKNLKMEFFLTYCTILITIILQIKCLPVQNGCPPVQIQEIQGNASVEVHLPYLYHNVEPILKILQSPQYSTHEGAQQVLNVYQVAKERKRDFEKAGGQKNNPLIVLEGLAGSGKSTLVKGLARKINAIPSHSPSDAFHKFRHLFLNDSTIDNIYHYFAHYVTALEVQILLKDFPVILDRFWHSTATYSIARMAHITHGRYRLPPKGDTIYNWPNDLLKPDAVLYLDIDEDIRRQRLYHREDTTEKGTNTTSSKKEVVLGKNEMLLQTCPDYRNNVISAYKNMDNPAVTFLNANLSIEDVLNEAYTKIKSLLGSR